MEYRTVKECFIECDVETLLNEFWCFWRTLEEPVPSRKYRADFMKVIKGIKDIIPNIGEKVIGVVLFDPYGDDSEYTVPLSVNENGIDLRALDVTMTSPGDEEKYSFKCDVWEDVLGYRMPDIILYEYGLETVMAAVLYEMTWFGYSAEEIHEYRGDIADALNEGKNK